MNDNCKYVGWTIYQLSRDKYNNEPLCIDIYTVKTQDPLEYTCGIYGTLAGSPSQCFPIPTEIWLVLNFAGAKYCSRSNLADRALEILDWSPSLIVIILNKLSINHINIAILNLHKKSRMINVSLSIRPADP